MSGVASLKRTTDLNEDPIAHSNSVAVEEGHVRSIAKFGGAFACLMDEYTVCIAISPIIPLR
jgi:hypothetical protein